MIALSAVVVFAMYTVCPGAGPRYLFHDDFPFGTKAIAEPHAVIFAEPVVLNTTPSGHLAWALLVFWCVRQHSKSKFARWMAGGFCALTAVSTMGTGEHYLIDLVLALPFAAGIWDMVMGRWKFALGYWLAVVVWSVASAYGMGFARAGSGGLGGDDCHHGSSRGSASECGGRVDCGRGGGAGAFSGVVPGQPGLCGMAGGGRGRIGGPARREAHQ